MSHPLMPLPNYVNIANKINHFTLPTKQVSKSEALSESVRTVVKHLKLSKKPEAAKTSRLADLEADVFTPERQTSKGISEKSKNMNQNHGDKAAMEKYFDNSKPYGKEDLFADMVDAEEKLMYKNPDDLEKEIMMQESQKQLDEAKKVWEEYLGIK